MQPDPHVVYQNETIVAIATPPGRGGIGIVRLSGPEAARIAEPMLRLRNPLVHAQARFADLLDLDTQETLDEAVVTYFRAPHSYTAEDVVEIAAHGAPVLLEYLVGFPAGYRPLMITMSAYQIDASSRPQRCSSMNVGGTVPPCSYESKTTAADRDPSPT